MRKHPEHRRDNSTAAPDQSFKHAQAEAQNPALFYTAVISRVIYAVLVVGFAGYYMDKALQIVRQ
jgi:hypothetical protein